MSTDQKEFFGVLAVIILFLLICLAKFIYNGFRNAKTERETQYVYYLLGERYDKISIANAVKEELKAYHRTTPSVYIYRLKEDGSRITEPVAVISIKEFRSWR